MQLRLATSYALRRMTGAYQFCFLSERAQCVNRFCTLHNTTNIRNEARLNRLSKVSLTVFPVCCLIRWSRLYLLHAICKQGSFDICAKCGACVFALIGVFGAFSSSRYRAVPLLGAIIAH